MMDRYDSVFDFRRATIDDVDDIMLFIKSEWGDDHILANNRELFLWQYGNTEYGDNRNINMILMVDRSTKLIVGINGYILYSNDLSLKYISSAITKVKSGLTVPLCGVEMIKRFISLVSPVAEYSSGTNPKTMIPISKRVLNYDVGMMQQFYMLNEKEINFNVAIIKDRINHDTFSSNEYDLIYEETFDNLIGKYDFERQWNCQGYKSKEFIEKRYFQHPIYVYKVFGVKKINSNDIVYEALLVGREIRLKNVIIFRIVDFIGDIERIGDIGKSLQHLILENSYEYIDFVVSNLPEKITRKAGLILRKPGDVNIIPMYFEPFLQKNIDIWFQRSDKQILIFKADGDQDRPNVISNI